MDGQVCLKYLLNYKLQYIKVNAWTSYLLEYSIIFFILYIVKPL